MRSAVIIYNPTAGRFSVKPFIKSAVTELESAGWHVDIVETVSGEHIVELAKQAAAEKKEAVFAVGGVLICLALLSGVDFSGSVILLITILIGGLNWLAVRK